jgi:hypothetical protein
MTGVPETGAHDLPAKNHAPFHLVGPEFSKEIRGADLTLVAVP